MGLELGHGVIRGVLLKLLGRIPPGTGWHGRFTLSEGGPKTYRVAWEIGFGTADATRYVGSFRLARSDFALLAEVYPAVTRVLTAWLVAACRASRGNQRFRVDRVEWVSPAADPGP